MRKFFVLGMAAVMCSVAGCAGPDMTTYLSIPQNGVYEIENIRLVRYSDQSLSTYSFDYIKNPDSDSEEKVHIKSFTAEEANGLRHVLITNDEYEEDCYVIDAEHEEYLYLTPETYRDIKEGRN
jgi:hypothetical protein